MAKPFDSSTVQTDSTLPIVLPQASQRFADPAMELATRNILASYFGTSPDDPGLIGRPIPVPVQQVAGLSPLEIQARNLAGGLGAFGGQLAEAQELFRQAGQRFDPATAAMFADPRARALYEASIGAYDPSTGERFVDQRARQMMEGAVGDIAQAGATIPGITGDARRQIGLAGDQAQVESAIGQQALRRGAGQVGGVIGAGQRGLGDALTRGLSATDQATGALISSGERAARQSDLGEAALRRGAGQIGDVTREGLAGLSSALALGQTSAGRAGSGIEEAARGITGQVGGAQTGAEEAARRARAQTEMAGADLRSAGQMGQAAALQGIAGLAGTGAAFDPSDIAAFQDPFTQEVIEAQQAEIARLGEQQKRDARAQQIRAGAFGGSRGAIQEAEIGRNVLQQQAKTGAELRSQGFQQAAQQAQSAFEQAQARRQQAAQLTGSLGQAGAGTALQAAGQAGQLGLSAEQLAQRGALEGGQLGLSGQQGIGSLLGQAGQFGMQAAEMGRGVASERAALAMQGIQSEADLQNRAAQLGMSAEEFRSRIAQQAGDFGLRGADLTRGVASEQAALGMQGIQSESDLANRAAQLGISTQQLRSQLAQQGGALGLQGAQAQAGLAGQRADIAQGIGQLGLQGQQLGANVFGQQMNRTAGAAAGLGGLTQGQFGSALQAFGQGTGAQRAAASGIAGLGQQGQQMLGTQIQTLGQLGTTGRGIQQRGLDAQYTAATQLADEPFMRLQRGQQLLQGGAQFMPHYTTGYGAQAGQAGAYQQPSDIGKAGNIFGQVGSFVKGLFGEE